MKYSQWHWACHVICEVDYHFQSIMQIWLQFCEYFSAHTNTDTILKIKKKKKLRVRKVKAYLPALSNSPRRLLLLVSHPTNSRTIVRLRPCLHCSGLRWKLKALVTFGMFICTRTAWNQSNTKMGSRQTLWHPLWRGEAAHSQQFWACVLQYVGGLCAQSFQCFAVCTGKFFTTNTENGARVS